MQVAMVAPNYRPGKREEKSNVIIGGGRMSASELSCPFSLRGV